MAAQDAELKLKVSLDLAFFRQQLAGLGQAAAGYNLPLNVKLDRSVLTKELRNLERAVGKKKINVELNILGGLTGKQLTAIQDRLEALSKTRKVEVPVSVKNGATGQDISKTIASIKERIGSNQQIKQGGGKLRVPLSVKPSITNADVADFKRAIREKFSGISIKVKADIETGGKSFAAGPTGLAGLQEYMRTQGMSGGNVPGAAEIGRRAQFEKAINEATSKELKRMLQTANVAGRAGLTTKAQMQEALLKINDVAMENILGNLKMQMQGPLPIKRSFLDQVARAVFWMAGVDPAYLRQQAAQRRALPFVDFPGTVPQRNISIGPSSSGRALPQGAIPGALPGTAFRQQKYLPTDLGVETKEILRDAAYAFLDAIKQGVRTVNVQDLGTAPSRQPLLGAGRVAGLLPGRAAQANVLELNNILAGAIREYFKAIAAEIRKGPQGAAIAQSFALPAGRQIAGLLPPAGGTTPRGQMRFNAVSAGAVLGQPSFMRAPSIPRAAGGGVPPVPPVPPGGGGGGGGMGGFGRAMGSINLPGAGTIRELGSEFAFATKQVLLFGQAYKLLGFIQAFPGQVGQAVAQLQSFRNTLNAVSPTAEEAAASNRLILDLVEKYNVPLQSARDGFTKLYASMAPAGFQGDEIRELFTGITKAAATFGMSADKVDRVNYAFAQMASKGQVMSEELKGQLGDVLPGAMALFAKAAGFEGPKAIQDFSAALEDGRYKGEAMVALLKNVGIVMNKEFGPGAEGAALTFQGIINRMQNSMKLLYESFEPVAVGFLNTVVVPLTDGIKQLSDGFTAFFSGSAAKTAGGFAIAQELERLKPAFDGIRANAAQLGQVFAQFGKIALDVAKVLLQIAGNPVVGYLARVYANVLILTTAIQILNLRALIPLVASFARSAYALIAFTVQCARAGQAAQVMGLMVRTAGITLRTFFATTGVGLVLVGIGLLIERFTAMNQRLDETRQKAIGAASAIRMMSGTEAIAAERSYGGMARSLEGLNAQLEQGKFKGKAWIAVNKQQQAALEAAGVIPSIVRGQAQIQPFRIAGAYQKVRQLESEAGYRRTQLQFEETQALQPVQLGAIPPSEGKTKGGKGEKLDQYNRSQLDFIDQRLEKEKQILDQQLQLNLLSKTSYDIKLAELTFETEKAKLQEQFRLNAERINKDNLSSADKALALKDQEVKLANGLAIAEKQRDIAVKGAKLELRKPFVEALRDENIEIDKQNTLLDNLKNGYDGLTPAQEASFIIEQKVAGLKADEQRLIKGEIDKLKEVIALRIQQANALKIEQTIKGLRDQLDLLRAIGEEESRRLRIAQENQGATQEQLNRIYDLEKIRDNIKAVRELIDSFVADTTSDYKNFLGEIISGKDAGDALREFQKSLKDRVLKIFLDFSMAPVEKFFKETLNKFAVETLFPKTDAEKAPAEAQKETALEQNTTALKNLTLAIEKQITPPATPQSMGQGAMALPVINYGTPESLSTVSESLSAALSNVETSIADTTAVVDKAANDAGANGATGKKWQDSLGKVVQGVGIAASSIMGIAAGISQIKEGGTSNVLGGIGSILLSIGGAIGGISSLFPKKAANGAVWKGGFTAFADGGVVKGPTLGLIGEGKYNEAIVPLPDGKSIPVQMQGPSIREIMASSSTPASTQPVLNMKFETTTIAGVEYVSRDQLERAMAETRKLAANDGARRGMGMTLDRLQQSPRTRSQIGLR